HRRRRGARAHAHEARPCHRSAVRGRLCGRRHRGGPREMELTHEFSVPVGIVQAWAVLTDVERIAPCMPGAELREVEGDEYRGIMADVSNKLLGQFVACLETKLGEKPPGNPVNPVNRAAAEGPRTIESAPAEPVNLLGAAGAPVLKRVLPVVAAGVVAYLLFR